MNHLETIVAALVASGLSDEAARTMIAAVVSSAVSDAVAIEKSNAARALAEAVEAEKSNTAQAVDEAVRLATAGNQYTDAELLGAGVGLLNAEIASRVTKLREQTPG